MQTIRLNSTGPDVELLQQLLCKWGYKVNGTGVFDAETDAAVRKFQRDGRLDADGIVGKCTWDLLQNEDARALSSYRINDADYERAAGLLGVEVAAVKAVLEVETGNKGGFLSPGYPTILFEGHIFWSQLKERGIDPEKYQKGNEDILYPKWDKSHYKGGMKEYDRLEKARAIHREAADSSASWGLAQIMGFNYKACGCKNVSEFVDDMTENEGKQLDLFVRFLQGNKWDKYLRTLDWKEFARHYNGPSYAQNQYDTKLENAYKKYK